MQGVHDIVIVNPSTEFGGLAICCDGDFLQLTKIDLYAMLHRAQCLCGSMTAIDGQKVDVVFPSEFDLDPA